MKIYGDTNTLPGNASGVRQKESVALQQLQSNTNLRWLTSRLVQHEAMRTGDPTTRETLIGEHEARLPIPNDEKLLGFNYQGDQYGGFINSPMISDVQDENIRAELIARGLEQKDAEHITQAICNNCDVFLTLDEKTIIKPHRAWLEQRFPTLRVRRPSELLEELTSNAIPAAV